MHIEPSKRIDVATIGKLQFLEKHFNQLTVWEQSLVKNRLDALDKFKAEGTSITARQLFSINEIFKKISGERSL